MKKYQFCSYSLHVTLLCNNAICKQYQFFVTFLYSNIQHKCYLKNRTYILYEMINNSLYIPLYSYIIYIRFDRTLIKINRSWLESHPKEHLIKKTPVLNVKKISLYRFTFFFNLPIFSESMDKIIFTKSFYVTLPPKKIIIQPFFFSFERSVSKVVRSETKPHIFSYVS